MLDRPGNGWRSWPGDGADVPPADDGDQEQFHRHLEQRNIFAVTVA
ncbi:hypothetical protein [Nocardia sp. CA-135398]